MASTAAALAWSLLGPRWADTALLWSMPGPRAEIQALWNLASGRSAAVPIGYTAPAAASAGVAWALTGPASSKSLRWALASASEIDLPIRYAAPAAASADLAWALTGPSSAKSLRWALSSAAETSIPIQYTASAQSLMALRWPLAAPSSRAMNIRWSLLLRTPAARVAGVRWMLSGVVLALPAVTPDLIRVTDGRRIGLVSVRISGDESSWLWSMDAEIADRADWQALSVGDVVSVTMGTTEFRMVLDGHQRAESLGSLSLSVSGRSPTVRLTDASAADGIMASDVFIDTVQAAGLSADWNTVDWRLPSAAELGESALEACQAIADAIGGVLQSSPIGDTLIIAPRHPVSPVDYGSTDPDAELSEVEHILSLDSRYEWRPSYDSVDILGSGAAAVDPVYQWRQEPDGDARLIYLSVVPWSDVDLQSSAGGHADIVYVGPRTETVTEGVTLVDGAGKLSSPFLDLVSVAWRYTDCGDLSISESGEIAAQVQADTLVTIEYLTRSHVWRATADVPEILVYVERTGTTSAARVTVMRAPGTAPAPAVVDPLLRGVPAARERGRNVLDDYGPRDVVGLVVPLEGAVILPGYIVRAGDRVGKAIAVTLTASVGSAPEQSLTMEIPRAS